MSAGRPPFIAAAPVIIAAACLIARWILVIGFGDFGTDYDLVSRLAAGQRQGKDFYSVFPPLSGYPLLLFAKLFGQHYLAVNVNLWFWWAVNVFVTRHVMVVLSGNGVRANFVGMAVALLTVPPTTHGVAFAYLASALSGLAVACLWQHVRTRCIGLALAAGIFGGLAVFAKPNVGLGIIGSMIVVCWGRAAGQSAPEKRAWSVGAWVVSGALLGMVAAIAMPGLHGAYAELLKDVFIGGGQIKGGLVAMAARTVPRIATTITAPNRLAIEFGATLLPVVVVLGGVVQLLREPTVPRVRDADTDRLILKLLWLLTAAVVALSAWSFVPHDFPHRLTAFFYDLHLVSLPFFSWQLLYIAVVVGLGVSVLVGLRQREFTGPLTSPFWASALCLMWTMAVVASARHNVVFATTLVFPVIAHRYGRVRQSHFYLSMALLLLVWTISWHIAPNWRSTFARLTELPAPGPFSHLYWPEGGASVPGSYPVWSSSKTIAELQKHIVPRVQGKVVLWLVPGPGAAFGGKIYTFGIHAMSSNNVPAWVEKRFGEGVRSRPPDFIVTSSFDGWNDPKWSFMRPDVIEPWLRDHYRLVWTLTDNPAPISLWERK